MPSTYFFATKADLEPGLAALQRVRPLQCTMCEPGGWLEDTTIPSFVPLPQWDDRDYLPSHSLFTKNEIKEEETGTFLLCDVNAPVIVESRPYWRDQYAEDTMRNQVVSTPVITFTPGGPQVEVRTIAVGNLTADYVSLENMRLYQQVEETLLQGFTRLYNFYYGPEALSLGKEGFQYAFEPDDPHETWPYEGLLESSEEAQSKIRKPGVGRLSLEDSWDWLEAEGYEVKRRADGTPDPYPRRPTQSCSMERGFSMFRTFIDHFDLNHLTIPRSYLGKVRAYQTSFRQSDLSRSRLAAGLFSDCDFRETDFSGALLANSYAGCTFENAILIDTDFRSAWFEACVFTGAKMKGAKLLKCHAPMLTLSETQQAEIEWHEDTDTGPDVGEW